ncbi:McrB family protein [Anaeromyxobacter oryzisoli]|uniref:McrB family protein n=1 Tax=Anaeromyxobacter oryzisoli TaxID=2925408 RepID=UPI001F5ABBDA|nr:AAA family ATPase [Anaeromyxobacter sp. SG63]
MTTQQTGGAAWFVGASYGGTEDQTARFVAEGIWENGYEDRYLDLVRSIRPGDRIAIKAAYTRKRDLPFDARANTVSVMAIKAIGVVTKNLNDGRRLEVRWTPVSPPREWYFFTGRTTVWRVLPGEWAADALLAFAFEGAPQDLARFRNAPYWRERFGDTAPADRRFLWTRFYEALADRLAAFHDRRGELLGLLAEISKQGDVPVQLEDRFSDGTTGFVRDIDPFTFLGLFNRGITTENRRTIAGALAAKLGVTEPVPADFDGIPVLHNQKSWFFGFEKERDPEDIPALWRVLRAALAFADSDGDDTARAEFIAAYDHANGRAGVAWNLTIGLYWIRPWKFLGLDAKSREYLENKLKIAIGRSGPKRRCSAQDYLAAMEVLETRFQEPSFPVHSYPETSLEAWLHREPAESPSESEPGENAAEGEHGSPTATDASPTVQPAAPLVPYSLDQIVADGCFLERAVLERMLAKLRTKKNMVLQGPPGTGKTWLAKRLAYALVGQRDESRVRAVQFHAGLSYEDFVRGLRPNADGKLVLVDGLFMEAVKAAIATPAVPFVVVIEELNRGNPAQILGEMLTLLEADKRTPDEALVLCHARPGERVYIPSNLYVIATMNIADRSLALVDLALRRRFAFMDLEPQLGPAWRAWVVERCGMTDEFANEVQHRMRALNETIAGDPSLGAQFRVGHSFVTPPPSFEAPITREWFRGVVESEIGPLLDEYWFDARERALAARGALVEGL